MSMPAKLVKEKYGRTYGGIRQGAAAAVGARSKRAHFYVANPVVSGRTESAASMLMLSIMGKAVP